MVKFKMTSWKLEVSGEFNTEEEAIKVLADRYMSCSKCDPPEEHFVYLLTQSEHKVDYNKIAKVVAFYVYEEVYGIEQWVKKYRLNIYPFKKSHWWKSTKGFDFKECEFRYEIRKGN